jgi:hypothetical protein
MVLTVVLQPEHAYVMFVAIASVIEVMLFGIKVGSLRKKLNVPYPKVTGPDEFDRVSFIRMTFFTPLGYASTL